MGLLEREMEDKNECQIRLDDVVGVDWGVTMVKGLVMGEQGECTDKVMRCDL
jgi:hypothetical protein